MRGLVKYSKQAQRGILRADAHRPGCQMGLLIQEALTSAQEVEVGGSSAFFSKPSLRPLFILSTSQEMLFYFLGVVKKKQSEEKQKPYAAHKYLLHGPLRRKFADLCRRPSKCQGFDVTQHYRTNRGEQFHMFVCLFVCF